MVGRRALIRWLRWIVWAILIALVVGILVQTSYHEERQQLAWAKCRLLEGNFEAAAGIYDVLTDSYRNGSEARTGSVLSHALAQHEISSSQKVSFHDFPISLLLHQALLGGRFEACLRLVEVLVPDEPVANLFRAVLLLELGRAAQSLTIWDGLSSRQKESWLGRRFQRVTKRLESDPLALVYDRRGKAFGKLSRAGALEPETTVSREIFKGFGLSQLQNTVPDRSLRLSIDLELSGLAQEALAGYCGSIVVLLRTGDVVVSVSDPKTLESTEAPAFHQLREPASISKLITAAAALRAGLDVDRIISRISCRGAKRYRGGILYCAYPAGPLRGLNHAMAVSCNIAFADLGIRVGRERMLEELGQFGFDRPPESGIEFGTILNQPGNERQLADLSIGLVETAITPVHAALIAAVFANQGVMPVPRLVSAQDGWLGLSPKSIIPARGWRVMDPDSVSTLLKSMEAVVQRGGTAHGLSMGSFPVAVKTGTGRNQNLGFHTNYIGVAPMPDPKFAFCIRITNQPTSGRVRRATFHVAKRLFRALSENLKWDGESAVPAL